MVAEANSKPEPVQQLSVRASEDNQRIAIEGTIDALKLVHYLIGELLKRPADKVIRAIKQEQGQGIEIYVAILPEE
jgi:hypothetical protein